MQLCKFLFEADLGKEIGGQGLSVPPQQLQQQHGIMHAFATGEITEKPGGGSLKPSATAPVSNHIFGRRSSLSSLRDKRQSM